MESEEQQPQQPTPRGSLDINRVIEEAREVLTNPAGFYRDMPRSGGFTEPVIFVAVMAVATGVIAAVWSLFTTGPGFLAAGFAGIIVYPIFAVIGAFIAAAILFVIWKLMGSERDYESAFRCWSAATAVYPVGALLSIIPYIGVMVSVAWGTLLMIEASVAVHQRERRTAMIVFGILGGLLLVSNVSSEYASRQMADHMSEMSRQFEGYEDMSPEEAGRKMGEFLKGLEEGAKKDSDEG